MDTDQNVSVLLFSIFLLAAQVVLTRWIFKIKKTEAYQRSTILLLKEIALKHGVEVEKIDIAMSYFKKTEE